MRRFRRILLWLSGGLLALAVVAIAALFLVDLSSFRPTIQARVSEALGRPVTIAGELSIKPSLRPTLAAGEIAVANIPGGSRAEMARVGEAEFGIELLPLLNGDIRITHIVIAEADILLERTDVGVANWAFGAQQPTAAPTSGDSTIPFIGRVELRNVDLRLALPEVSVSRIEVVEAQISTPSMFDAVAIELDGRLNGETLKLSATTGPLGSLLAGDERWPLEAELRLAGNRMILEGSLDDPMALAGVSIAFETDLGSASGLQRALGLELVPLPAFRAEGTVDGRPGGTLTGTLAVEAAGARVTADASIENVLALSEFSVDFTADVDSLAALAPMVGGSPPPVPPFRASGTVSGNRSEIRLADLALTAGESDLSGHLTAVLSSTPPSIRGEIRSRRLTVADLAAAMIDAADQEGGPQQGTAPEAQYDPLDQTLPLDALAAANLDLTLSAGEILVGGATIADSAATIRLQDRRLAISIPGTRLSQGTLTANLTVNARQWPPSMRLDLATERFNLGGLLRDLQITDALALRIDATVNLDTTGATGRDLLAGLNGGIAIESDEGEVNARFAGLFGKSLLTAMLPIGDNDRIDINCSIAYFDVTDGVVQSRALGMDTRRATINGTGGLDLKAQTLDFLFNPQPKDMGLVNLVAPVRIEGPLADPEIAVLTGEALANVAADSLLIVLVPYALILPFVPGISDKPENCQTALYETLTTPPQSAPRRIVEGTAGAVGAVGGAAVGVVEGTVKGVGGALGAIGRGVGGLFRRDD